VSDVGVGLKIVCNAREVKNIYAFACHPTLSVKALCIRAARPPRPCIRSFFCLDRSCYKDISYGLSNLDETYSEYSVAPN